MKRFYPLIAASLFALISCNKEDAIKTPYQDEFNTTHENLEFDARGGKVTMQIPFDDYYLHYVLNQDSVVFFYLKEKDYDQLGTILKRRDIVKKIGGREIKAVPDLQAAYDEAITNLASKTQIGVDVLRAGRPMHFILNYRNDPESEEEP